MRKLFVIILGVIAVLGITERAFSATNALADKCYQAEIVNISGEKYFPAVKEALSKAKESINMVMFAVESVPKKEDSKVNQLINELVEAKNRGVEVEVILDQNVDFIRKGYSSDWEKDVKNIDTYIRFKEAGIKVYYDEPQRYMHAKSIVIDRRRVVLGSTNWSESAFAKNIEVSVLIESEELAQNLLGYFKTIKIDENIEEYKGKVPSTPISLEFLKNPRFAPLLVNDHSERAFDVYLFLLRKFDGNPEGKLSLFFDTIAKYLGIYEGWSELAYRRQIIKVLRQLDKRYKLIKFYPRYAKEAEVVLLNYNDSGKAYKAGDEYFELPDDYFDFGWNRNLSLRAKFCLFINLACSAESRTKPFWSKSVAEITKQFGGVGRDVISKGMGELRREKIIDVEYDALSGKRYEERTPKIYKLLKLYDPKEQATKQKELEEKYGNMAYNKARGYAEVVFEENNPEVVEDIILKMKECGEEKVREAFNVVAEKNPDNPKRTYSYTLGIIERL